ncbi:MAG: DNA starvation/stationary phase protection protein [Bacteroidetes bacterium]|nr:DNA starvation/stationary phase protection protein [Bacteroidota bacterium]
MNKIGINKTKADLLSAKLNELLANYQVYYMNVRGFHWNVKGNNFFELHLKFEELYNNLLIKVDEIAERILTLGEEPLHTYTNYLNISEIKEIKGVSNGKDGIRIILDAFEILIKKQREILSLAGEAEDEGTNALMSDYIREQEKLVWMYNAYIS